MYSGLPPTKEQTVINDQVSVIYSDINKMEKELMDKYSDETGFLDWNTLPEDATAKLDDLYKK
ncbi:MAG: hypothetical protein CM15mV42_0800 [uncultured marine virus]|nr:MAG: hypothetical protein CM15mV42_0800 [uncultured marine virus]